MAKAATGMVLSPGKAIVFFKVFQRKPKGRGIPVGSKMVLTQSMDQPHHMNTRAITWIPNYINMLLTSANC